MKKKSNLSGITDFTTRAIQIVALGIIIAAAGYFFVGKKFALGVVAGVPVSVINLLILLGGPGNLKGEKDPYRMQKRFLAGALVRMVISFTVLLVAARWGIYFMLGVFTGLILQMLTYFKDAIKILVGKG